MLASALAKRGLGSVPRRLRRVQQERAYTQRHNVTFLPVQRRTTTRGYIMEAQVLIMIILPGIAWALAPRDEVMFTGRRRIMLLSREDEAMLMSAMGSELEEMEDRLLKPSHALHQLTTKVARKVVAAAAANGVSYDWSVNVLRTPQRNAFCMPGGTIVVTTSMLDWLHNQVKAGTLPDMETGLAAILSHEVAHAVAQHSAEGLAQIPAKLIMEFLSTSSPLLPPLVEVSLNLPYSRMVEREADTIGFVLYSYTEYDLEAYPMLYAVIDSPSGDTSADEEGGDEEEEGGAAPVEWLSTHPSGMNRAQDTAALLPLMREARKSLREPLTGLQRTVRGLWGGLERDGAQVKLVPWQHVPELHQALEEHAAAQWRMARWSWLPGWLSGSTHSPGGDAQAMSPMAAAESIAQEQTSAHNQGSSGPTDGTPSSGSSTVRRGPSSLFDCNMRGEEQEEGDR